MSDGRLFPPYTISLFLVIPCNSAVWGNIFVPFLAHLLEEHRELLQYPLRERDNVYVFGASTVEACHSFNIHTRCHYM